MSPKIKKLSWSQILDLVKTTFREFLKGESFMHGAALAYYAIFALVPIIYLAISSVGLILGQERIIEIIAYLMESNMGIKDVSTFTDLMYKWGIGSGGTLVMKIVGIVVLLFTSSAMFNSLRNSLNAFFDVEARASKNALIQGIVARGVSVGIMTILAIIVIVVYFAHSMLLSVGDQFLRDGGWLQTALILFLEHFTIIFINFLIFLFVFKYLHDGKMKWKIAFAGSIFTAILLYLGQLLINYYLTNFFFAADSGVVGTIFAILTWIFYTSQIIFLGAKFTAVYARKIGKPIEPK
ncbi:MAG: YihY/virulence factor BrkB family protein [Brumimicrobium sp.]|nr:YihY/virulence factor BrkB family protein [Brumimicrobium sp.]